MGAVAGAARSTSLWRWDPDFGQWSFHDENGSNRNHSSARVRICRTSDLQPRSEYSHGEVALNNSYRIFLYIWKLRQVKEVESIVTFVLHPRANNAEMKRNALKLF